MSERIVGFEKTRITELVNPVALRMEINNVPVSDYNKVSFMFIKAEVPFATKRLLYLPEYYISMQRIKDIDEEFVGISKDVADNYISKISIIKNSITNGKIENFYTLAYIAYLGLLGEKRYQFSYDHMGSIYYHDHMKGSGIESIEPRPKRTLYMGSRGVEIAWDVKGKLGKTGRQFGER